MSYKVKAIDTIHALLDSHTDGAFFTGNERGTGFSMRNGVFYVSLYNTIIVSLDVLTQSVMFNHGGFKTRLTVQRINQVCNALGLAYSARKKNGQVVINDLGNGEWTVGPCGLILDAEYLREWGETR